MGIRSLVVGIDGSETSYRAFAMAVALAVREQGCVHACFVSHVPVAAVWVPETRFGVVGRVLAGSSGGHFLSVPEPTRTWSAGSGASAASASTGS